MPFDSEINNPACVTFDRDPAFWRAVNAHPDVNPHTSLGRNGDIGAFVAHPGVTPLRADHGGVLLVPLDGAGQVVELHIMFTPEGRGRNAFNALASALAAAFDGGAQVVTTYQVEGASHWKPPTACGFVRAGEYQPLHGFNVQARSWVLTRAAWLVSPACRRLVQCPG